MSVRKVRRQFEFEALERRETPSAGLGASGIQELARHAKTVALIGSGKAVYSSTTSAEITGRSTILGNFTGTITATSATSSVVVLDSGSNQLDLTVNGSYGKGKTPHFKGTFTITGGTNQFAGFTGKGNVSGTLNLTSETLKFNISGKVTE